jgi:hypothetical protein
MHDTGEYAMLRTRHVEGADGAWWLGVRANYRITVTGNTTISK